MNEITTKQQEGVICSQDNGQGSVVSIESTNGDLNGNISHIDNFYTVEGDRTVSSSDSLSVQSSFREDEEEIQIEKNEKNDTASKPKKQETHDAREKRLDQNRKAARDSRIRKKNMVTDLQRSVTYFSRANLALQQQNEILQRYLDNALIHIRSVNPVNFYQAAPNTTGVQQQLPAQQPLQQYCTLNNSTFIQTQMIKPKSVVQHNTFYIPHVNNRSSMKLPNIPTTEKKQTFTISKNILPILPQTQLNQQELGTSSSNITKNLIHHIPPVAPPVIPQVAPPVIPKVTPPIPTPLHSRVNPSLQLKAYAVPNPLATLDQIIENECPDPDSSNFQQDSSFSNQFFDSNSKPFMDPSNAPATFCSNIDVLDSIGFIPVMESSIFQELLNEFRK